MDTKKNNTIHKRKCIICGDEFEAYGRQLTCGREHKCKCPICGEEFNMPPVGSFCLRDENNKILRDNEKNNLLPPYNILNINEDMCLISLKECICKKCKNIEKHKKIAATQRAKGVAIFSKEAREKAGRNAHTSEAKNKRKQTCLDRYGSENPMQNKEIIQKNLQSKFDKHGYTSVFQIPEIMEKVVKASQSHEANEKRKKTCLEKYGCENPAGNKEVIRKRNEVNKRNHGGVLSICTPESIENRNKIFRDKNYQRNKIEKIKKENNGVMPWNEPENHKKAIEASKTPEAKEKRKKTQFDNHNGMYAFNTPEAFKNNWSEEASLKRKQTCLEKYGVPYNIMAFNYNMYDSILNHNNNSYHFRSSWELYYALYLISNSIDFEYETINISYNLNNKNHIYIPDFYIPSKNKIVEIKGYVDKKDIPKFKAKCAAVENSNYNFELIIGNQIDSYIEFCNNNFSNMNEIITNIKDSKKNGEVYEFNYDDLIIL